MRWWILSAACAAAWGCGGETTPDGLSPRAARVDAAITPPARCPAPRVQVVATDAWGRAMPEARVTLAGEVRVEATLAGPGELGLSLEAEDHLPVRAELRWDGARALEVEGARLWAVSLGAEPEPPVPGLECARFTAFVGLQHRWFSPEARPWHAGNAVRAFDRPDEAWADVAAGVSAAREEVLWFTWWWQSETLLVRGQPFDATAQALAPDTALGRLAALPDSVRRRVLINYFLDQEGAFFLTTDAALRAYAEDHGDAVEVMGHADGEELSAFDEYPGVGRPIDFGARLRARPEWSSFDLGPATRGDALGEINAASFHMKGVVVDGAVAWVLGLNTQPSYWDAPPHAVFEPRRMPVTVTAEEREDVAAHRALPEYGPYRDYGVRLRGPVVAEVAAYFGQMWARARADAEIYAEDTTPYEVPAPPAAAGQSKVQIQVTMPPPEAEQSILDGQLRAIRQAERYILVEDQYWRATRLLDALEDALERHPALVLIVATNQVGELDGGKKWTIHTDERLREVGGDRYLLLQLRTMDVQTAAQRGGPDEDPRVIDEAIKVHSKMMIIDDRFVSIGSANKNNRSLLYDGEMVAAILDPAVARALRASVLAAWVGGNRAPRLGADMGRNLAVLRETALENRGIVEAWKTRLPGMSDGDIAAEAAIRPNGLVFLYRPEGPYSLDPGPDFF